MHSIVFDVKPTLNQPGNGDSRLSQTVLLTTKWWVMYLIPHQMSNWQKLKNQNIQSKTRQSVGSLMLIVKVKRELNRVRVQRWNRQFNRYWIAFKKRTKTICRKLIVYFLIWNDKYQFNVMTFVNQLTWFPNFSHCCCYIH